MRATQDAALPGMRRGLPPLRRTVPPDGVESVIIEENEIQRKCRRIGLA
jgi:hypothetical protein